MTEFSQSVDITSRAKVTASQDYSDHAMSPNVQGISLILLFTRALSFSYAQSPGRSNAARLLVSQKRLVAFVNTYVIIYRLCHFLFSFLVRYTI